ncbi:MAG: SRPBCC family protein [Haloarculaceae archaeon]
MQQVTVTRRVAASPETVTDAIRDVGPFMRAGGFDGVAVEGDRVTLVNRVGLASIELELELEDREGAVLAYSQRDGIFEEMETWYEVAPADSGTEVRATTTFAIDVDLVGFLLDKTVVKRQRRRELEAQFDFLESL